MPRRTWVDWTAVSAAAPHKVITLRELTELHVPGRTVAARCAPGGPWKRLLPGVVMLCGGTPTEAQRLDAALRYVGPDAVLTGLTGARLHGLHRLPPTDRVHVLVPHPRQRATHAYVVVERTTRMPDSVSRDGWPVAPVARAVLDGARRLTDLDTVRAVIAEAVQRGLVHPDELRRELAAGSGRGSALPRRVLAEVSDGVHSVAEAWARALVRRAKLPPMLWNPRVHDANGRFLACPDGWLDDVALAWEIDSYEFHLSPSAYAATLTRRATMTGAGIIVVATLPSRLRTEPDAVLAELLGGYRLARGRLRPPVTVLPLERR